MLQATILRFELVMRINVVGLETLEHETLYATIAAQQLALIAMVDDERRPQAGALGDADTLVAFIARRELELQAAERARTSVEARYFDGHDVRFPNLAERWAAQQSWLAELAGLAAQLAAFDAAAAGRPIPRADDFVREALVDARAATLTTDLVEPARIATFEKLDEPRRAFAAAAGWLRSKAVVADTPLGAL